MGREVGEVLWPGISEMLVSARLELGTWLQGLRCDRTEVLRRGSRLARQEELNARTRRAGWCLGVLAAGRGVDLLHGRGEADGLRWMVGALVEACSFTATPPATELPRVAGGTCLAWEVSLLATWCALQVGLTSNGHVGWRAGEAVAHKWLAFDPPSSPRLVTWQ
jgi:hypothetical protein